jgi:hypothetical protein
MGSASMLEEFFVAPRDAPTDSLIYFPMVGDGGEGGGGDGVLGRGATQPQYGLQLHVANLMQAPPGAPTFPPLQHVRSGASVPQVRPRVSPAESLSRSHLTSGVSVILHHDRWWHPTTGGVPGCACGHARQPPSPRRGTLSAR